MAASGKVLVVLNDAAEARAIAEQLVAIGIDTVTAGDGIAGLALVSDAKPDLVICSRRLPKMDGLQVCKLIKRNHKLKHVAVLIILSEQDDQALVASSLEMGANDYLQRPLSMTELMSAVRSHLAQRTSIARLKDDNKELATILEISEMLTSTLSSSDLFYIIVHKMAETLDVRSCTLLRVAPDGATVSVEASLDPEDADRPRMALAEVPDVRRALSTGRMVYVEDARRDPEIAAAFRGVGSTSLLSVPLPSRQPSEGRIVFRMTRDSEPFTYREIKFCQIVTTVAANALENARLFESLEVAHASLTELSRKDPLTDVFNRRHLFERLEAEFARSVRKRTPLACVMLDIDHFKRVNDELGHQAGDAVLIGVAQVLKRCLRGQDLVGRYGGEEFLLILPETDEDGALMVAERIQREVRATEFEGAPGRQVTASLGVAIRAPDVPGVEALVALADRALYEAKDTGRDRTVVYPGLTLASGRP